MRHVLKKPVYIGACWSVPFCFSITEPCHKKACLIGFRSGNTTDTYYTVEVSSNVVSRQLTIKTAQMYTLTSFSVRIGLKGHSHNTAPFIPAR